jgi:hypothetical protein
MLIPREIVQQVLQKGTQPDETSSPIAKYRKRPIDPGRLLAQWNQLLQNKGELCLSVLLRGEIRAGDYSKIQRLIGSGVMHIDLISPGGDLTEAMKIGRLVRSHFIETEAPKFFKNLVGGSFLGNGVNGDRACEGPDCVCASACFFVWAAGVDREGTAVGLHRPSFRSDYDGTAADAELQYARAVKEARDYLEEMEVPTGYVDLLMRTKSKEIVVLGALHDGEGSLDDIVGYPPSIDEWLDTYCIALTPQELARYRSHPIDQAMVEKQVGIKMCRNSALSVARAKAMASAEH